MYFRRWPLSTDSATHLPWIESAVKNPASNARLLLWVDAVGGFLVCQGNEIRLGQAVPGSPIELPLLADLSRHHATIRRDEEGYTVEPLREVWLNDHQIDATSWLADGSLLQLGRALKLRFSRPHPLSATARLDFLNHHRTQPSASAVLLMADTCVLGPGPKSHVVCRDWPHEVVLHRQHGGLYCRGPGALEVDGKVFPATSPADAPLPRCGRTVFVQFGGNPHVTVIAYARIAGNCPVLPIGNSPTSCIGLAEK